MKPALQLLLALSIVLLIPLVYADDALDNVLYPEKVGLQTVYAVEASVFKNDSASLTSISADTGIVSEFYPEGSYSIKVLSDKRQELFSGGLSFSFTMPYPLSRELDPVTYEGRIPYFENARYITISHRNATILEIDLSKDLCNNNLLCETGENAANCKDCGLTNQVPDNESGSGDNPPESFPWIYVTALALCIILIATLLYLRKKKKESSGVVPPEPSQIKLESE